MGVPSKPKAPKAPEPPPPPEKQVEEELLRDRDRRRQQALQAQGRQGTILTGAQGLSGSAATVGTKTLLGT